MPNTSNTVANAVTASVSNGHVVFKSGRPIIVNKPFIPVKLGMDQKGQEQILDIACCRNIFIASNNQSEKDKILSLILTSLINHTKADAVKIIISTFDNRSEAGKYSSDSHMLLPGIVSEKAALRVLDYLYDENIRRSNMFKDNHQKWLIGYNEMVPEPKRLPFLIYVIDEVSGLMKSSRADFCRKVRQVTESSHFSGVMLIFATNDVSSETIRPSFIECFPKRIAFRMLDANQSNLVLGRSGAERLGPEKIFLREKTSGDVKCTRIKLTDMRS